jgi:hypothetical protein
VITATKTNNINGIVITAAVYSFPVGVVVVAKIVIFSINGIKEICCFSSPLSRF